MARIINRVPFHWAQSARQRPHYPVDNWSVLPFISILNAIKCHHWLSNLPSALGSGCLLRQTSASQIRDECSVRCSQRRRSHPTLIFSTWLFPAPPPASLASAAAEFPLTFHGLGWERWVYQRWAQQGAHPHEIINREGVWGPKNVISVRWCHKRYAFVGDSGNSGRGCATLVSQRSQLRLCITWWNRWTC